MVLFCSLAIGKDVRQRFLASPASRCMGDARWVLIRLVREIFKQELHPYGSLWLRRCAISATLSTEVFSQYPGVMRTKSNSCLEALYSSALLFTLTSPRGGKGRSRGGGCINLRDSFSWGLCQSLACDMALPASPSPSHSSTFLYVWTQPLSLICPSWD